MSFAVTADRGIPSMNTAFLCWLTKALRYMLPLSLLIRTPVDSAFGGRQSDWSAIFKDGALATIWAFHCTDSRLRLALYSMLDWRPGLRGFVVGWSFELPYQWKPVGRNRFRLTSVIQDFLPYLRSKVSGWLSYTESVVCCCLCHFVR